MFSTDLLKIGISDCNEHLTLPRIECTPKTFTLLASNSIYRENHIMLIKINYLMMKVFKSVDK